MKVFSGPECQIANKPVFYKVHIREKRHQHLKTLEQIIIDKMVLDSHTCKEARYSLPGILLEKLLSASLCKLRELSVLQLIQAWKYSTLKLAALIPNFGNDLFGLNEGQRSHTVLHDKYMNKIFKIFFHAVVEKLPETLKHIDLTDLPIVYYITDDSSWMIRSLKILHKRGVKITVNLCFSGLACSRMISDQLICEPPKGLCLHNINGTAFRTILSKKSIDPLKIVKLGIFLHSGRYREMNVEMKDERMMIVSEMSRLVNVEELCFHVDRISVTSINLFIKEMKKLKRLDIENEKDESYELNKLVPHLNNIEYLRVYVYSLNTDDIKAFEHCPRLSHLCLHASRSTFSDAAKVNKICQDLEKVMPRLRNLKIFEFETKTKLKTDFVSKLPTLCPYLDALKLSSNYPAIEFDHRKLLDGGIKWLVSLHFRQENSLWDGYDPLHHDVQEIKREDLSDIDYCVYRYENKALVAFNKNYTPPNSWFDFFKSQYSFW